MFADFPMFNPQSFAIARRRTAQEAKAQQQVQQQAKIAQDLRAMFIALDEDGSGTLTREDCRELGLGLGGNTVCES